jgi:hypothetical protein
LEAFGSVKKERHDFDTGIHSHTDQFSLYGVIAVACGLGAREMVHESHESRCKFYTGLVGLMVVGSLVWCVSKMINGAGDSNRSAFLDTLPLVGCFVYTSLMYHGHRRVDEPASWPVKGPEDDGMLGVVEAELNEEEDIALS